MNNDYIFIPKIDIDIDVLKRITNKRLRFWVPGLAFHNRLVKDEPELVAIKNKFPFLSEIYSIYWTPPKHIVPAHIDIRECAMNFPISYTEDSYTMFYKTLGKDSLTNNNKKNYLEINSDIEEVFRFTLEEPTIINTKVPHGMIGGPKRPRIILSWTIDTSFEKIKEYFK